MLCISAHASRSQLPSALFSVAHVGVLVVDIAATTADAVGELNW
jgi:hypothetical protein